MKTALPRLLTLAGALLVASPALSAETEVPLTDLIRHPSTPQGNHRNVIAIDHNTPGWRTFEGDLHAHARGHDDPSATINRNRSYDSAYYFGYDFLAVTNHTTSWNSQDQAAPIAAERPERDGENQTWLLKMNGVESYVGPQTVDNLGNWERRNHFNAFNNLLHYNANNVESWYNEIVSKYTPNPSLSVHIQLNHPGGGGDPWYQLPSASDPERRRKVRDAIELTEYYGQDNYFELLRRGFRVSPVTNTDVHPDLRSRLANKDSRYNDRNEDGYYSWAVPEAGVPRELLEHNLEPGRAGIVLPVSEKLNHANFLSALRARRTYSTGYPGSSGFFMANGRPMGSEFALAAGERRLDFSIWGANHSANTQDLHRFERVELWDPFQPDHPVKVLNYDGKDGSPALNLKALMNITPYSSIYVVRLQQGEGRSEVVLAPIWITNPVARPTVQFSHSGDVTRGSTPCLNVNGGGELLWLQRARVAGGLADSQDWYNERLISNDGSCQSIDTGELPASTQWRVVDYYSQEVASNAVYLTVSNALYVHINTNDTFVAGRAPLRVYWNQPANSQDGDQVRMLYSSSLYGNVWSAWTEWGRDNQIKPGGYLDFSTAAWGGYLLKFRVESLNHPERTGTSVPFLIADPQFSWSSAGPLPNKHCVRWLEPQDENTWDDNYLCSSGDQDVYWSRWGKLSDMACTQIHEADEPTKNGWGNNYLCVRYNSPLKFSWSVAGPVSGKTCVQTHEAADPHSWPDNYLCY